MSTIDTAQDLEISHYLSAPTTLNIESSLMVAPEFPLVTLAAYLQIRSRTLPNLIARINSYLWDYKLFRSVLIAYLNGHK